MAARGLARLDELDRLARANDWQTEQHTVPPQDLPEGCNEARGWMAAKAMPDGRDFSIIVVWGKPEGRQWQLLRDDGKYPVICSVDEPDTPHEGADMTIRFETLQDIEHWIPRLDELLQELRDEGTFVERHSIRAQLERARERM